jgi:3-deoxy-7-phosphoheptulonate synthase
VAAARLWEEIVDRRPSGQFDAPQQPPWEDLDQVRSVREELHARPPLVTPEDVRLLRHDLAQVAAGRAGVIQAGDCSEDPAESAAPQVAGKAGLVEMLAGALKMASRRPVVAAGRIAGQFGKPRSQPTQLIGGQELPVYRGHMVNDPEPSPEARRPDPRRLLSGYHAAHKVMESLGWSTSAPMPASDMPVWTSHEALLLDYEIPMLRRDELGELFLTSTHWPWIGERTRQVDGRHVALLAEVANPVACKLGPTTTPAEVVELCARLDPGREPGRLTLISRMGADRVTDALPPLVEAVRAAGHPVIWLCDPMHANTVTSPHGLKTRYLTTILDEVKAFQAAVQAGGAMPGGLHLETVAEDVTECVTDESCVDQVANRYTTLCDPRLNPGQAVAVVSAWAG